MNFELVCVCVCFGVFVCICKPERSVENKNSMIMPVKCLVGNRRECFVLKCALLLFVGFEPTQFMNISISLSFRWSTSAAHSPQAFDHYLYPFYFLVIS